MLFFIILTKLYGIKRNYDTHVIYNSVCLFVNKLSLKPNAYVLRN